MSTVSFRSTYALGAAIAFFGVAACGSHDHEDDHPHDVANIGPPTKATCPTTQTLTYANFGQSFMRTYCLRCHSASVKGDARQGAPSDHNFDSVDDIRGLADHIDQYAGSGPASTNTEMPRNDPKPSLQERQKLAEWLACKAP